MKSNLHLLKVKLLFWAIGSEWMIPWETGRHRTSSQEITRRLCVFACGSGFHLSRSAEPSYPTYLHAQLLFVVKSVRFLLRWQPGQLKTRVSDYHSKVSPKDKNGKSTIWNRTSLGSNPNSVTSCPDFLGQLCQDLSLIFLTTIGKCGQYRK